MKKRKVSRRNFAGFLITLALHGAILGAVRYAHSNTEDSLIAPRDVVVAKMVKLGKPREKFWLPRIAEPPRPQAPAQVLKVAEDPNAAKAPPEAPRPENPELSKNVRQALERARKLAALAEPEPDEGQLTGSAAGTANEASDGDAYGTVIFDTVRRNWTVPTGLISDAELMRLLTTIRIRIDQDGTISDAKLSKSSGNSIFDDSCMNAVQATHKLPPPPPNVRRIAARGYALEFPGKEMKWHWQPCGGLCPAAAW